MEPRMFEMSDMVAVPLTVPSPNHTAPYASADATGVSVRPTL